MFWSRSRVAGLAASRWAKKKHIFCQARILWFATIMSILRIFVTVVKCLLSRFEQKESFLVPLEKGSYPLLKTFDTQSKPSKKCVKHDIFCIHYRRGVCSDKIFILHSIPKIFGERCFCGLPHLPSWQKSDKSEMHKKNQCMRNQTHASDHFCRGKTFCLNCDHV